MRWVAIYGLVAPLEGVLAYAPGLTSIVELERRSGLLVSDLLALGVRPGDVSALAQCPLEAFADLPTAIGWLYLYERGGSYDPARAGCLREARERAELRLIGR